MTVNQSKVMIDFHSHALHGVDDGSKSLEESLEMLEQSAQQGISVMALTPHFYGDKDAPERFLSRRAMAMEQLLQAKKPHHPKLLAGAEVCYFSGIQRAKEISQLCLEGTPFLLLEMPFVPWTERMLNDLWEMNQNSENVVVLAHIDRYISMQKAGVIQTLVNSGIKLQANANSFLNWHKRPRMLRMMKQRQISFLGSDCHNLTTRPPGMEDAQKLIARKLGSSAIQAMNEANYAELFGDDMVK